MSKLIKILSIDGGGIRGIIPALILAEIEKRTQKPIAELFDLVAGASTGGILALGLVTPAENNKPAYKARKIARLYELKGAVAFPKAFQTIAFIVKNLQKAGIISDKYSKKFLYKVFEDLYNSTRISDALTDVLIPTYDIQKREAIFLTRKKAKENSAYDFTMQDVAYAGSAAPTYFDPIKLELPESDYLTLVDGGIYANNPALCALAEAKMMYPDAEDFLLLSLGTGHPIESYCYEQVVKWSRGDWTRKVMNMTGDGVSTTVDYQLKHLLPDMKGDKRYYRFQITLNPGNEAIDNASPNNLGELRALAEQTIDEYDEAINNLCKVLIS